MSLRTALQAALVIVLTLGGHPARSESLVAVRQVSQVDAGGLVADTVRAVPLSHEPFRAARAIAVDPLGALYVADAGRDVVVKMDADGSVAATIGRTGSRGGEFDDPSGVDPTNGLVLYVADAGNRRVQIFSRAFAYLGAISLGGGGQDSAGGVTYRRQDDAANTFPTGTPIAVATSNAGELFVLDAERRVVLKWNADRRMTAVIGDVDAPTGALVDPVDVAAGPESLLYVADVGERSVLVYDHFGTYVRTIGGGRLSDVRAVAVTGRATGRAPGVLSAGRVYALLPRALMVFDDRGRFEGRMEIQVGEDLVDVSAGPDGTLYAVSSRRAYRLALRP
ncbi:MAG: NHL repeat-containing protein [Rhodothermales bacterium]